MMSSTTTVTYYIIACA